MAKNGDLKVGDFGLSHQLPSRLKDALQGNSKEEEFGRVELKSKLYGTPNYLAPETISHSAVSFKTDVWSFGCIIYCLFYKRTPFEDQSIEQTMKNILSRKYFLDQKTPLEFQDFFKNVFQSERKRAKANQLVGRFVGKKAWIDVVSGEKIKIETSKRYSSIFLKSKRQFHNYSTKNEFKQLRGFGGESTVNRNPLSYMNFHEFLIQKKNLNHKNRQGKTQSFRENLFQKRSHLSLTQKLHHSLQMNDSNNVQASFK